VATHRIPILGFATRPDDTGQCWFEPADLVFGSNDLARQFLLRLGLSNAAEPTVKHGIYGSFRVPKNYIGTPVVVCEWSATVITNSVVFDFDYNTVAGSNAETLDPAAWQQSVTVTQAAPTTARFKRTATIALTAGNFAVDDIVQFFFGRDGVDAADNMAGAAWVAELTFEYADA
jgi:hypothetical protein